MRATVAREPPRSSRRGLHAANNGPLLVNSAVLACLLLASIEWAAIIRVIPDRAERGASGAQLAA